jgi:osmotically inducible lipoprotein OsmB
MHSKEHTDINDTERDPFLLLKVVVTTLALTLGACSMNETQERVGGGAALGAVAGALLGSSRQSAAIGAVVGAAGGYIYDQHSKNTNSEEENARLRAENERLRQDRSEDDEY